jgi:hypothetical protein
MAMTREAAMVYSYTQISQYLRCPRSYRYRYLDGWREKETRAAMVFGRCFEKALGAYFCEEDSAAVLFKEWEAYRDAPFEYRKGESWDRLFHQGVHLLETFARHDRIRIRDPKKNLQLKMLRTLPGGSGFVAYLDALGEFDGQHCLIDWKTTTSRYSVEPEGLLSLDPQLICYSWISGIPEVALVVFVRKCPRDSIFESVDLGRTAARVRAPGRDNHRPDRSGSVCCAQRYPLSPKRLPELPPSGALSEQPAVNRHESGAQGRSERP